MKKLSLLLMSSVLLSSFISFGQNEEETVDTYELKGPVKSISTSYYVQGKKKHPAALFMSIDYTFNTTGQLSEWMLDFSVFNFKFGSKTFRNEKGQIIREELLGSTDTYVTATYTYDENDKMIESQKLNEDGDVESTRTYSYDDNGLLIMIDLESENSDESVKYSYTYDESGRLSESKEERKYTTEITTFKYDDNDNIIEEFFKTNVVEKDSKGNFYTYRTYNENGDILEIIEKSEDGKLLGTEKRAYDENGNQTHAYSYDTKNKLKSYIVYFDFDKYGNWTESAEYHGKKLTSMDSRDIDYY